MSKLATKLAELSAERTTLNAALVGAMQATPKTGTELLTALQNAAGQTVAPVAAQVQTLQQQQGWRPVSLLQFMTPAQLADCELAVPLLDHTSAFTAFTTHLALTKRQGEIPARTYNLSATFHVPEGATVRIDGGARLRYTATSGAMFQVHKGATLIGGGSSAAVTSTAWNSSVFLVDGAEKIRGDKPVVISGFNVTGADPLKGAALKLVATGPGDSVAFCQFRAITSSALLDTIVLDCGSSGTSDPGTWHWINSNLFEDITSFSATRLLAVDGTATVPAEVAANKFINLQYQATDNLSGPPVRINGASQNTFVGLQIWDWNIGTRGSPITFAGGAQWNNIASNIDASQVPNAGSNKLSDLTGSETGPRIFLHPVAFHGGAAFGKAGQVGNYGGTFWPDVAGSAINFKNDGTGLSFATGGNPYGYRENIIRLTDYGHLMISPRASATPVLNGDMVFELTSNTSLKVKVKGSDGVVRSATLTLA